MLGEWMTPSACSSSGRGRRIVRISDLDWSRMDADRMREFAQVSRFHRWLIDRSRGLSAEGLWRTGSAAFLVDRRIDQMIALGWARLPEPGSRSRLAEGEVAVRVPAFHRSWSEEEGEILVDSARLVYARDVVADGSDATMGRASLVLVPLLLHRVLDVRSGRWMDPDEARGCLGSREEGDSMSASVAHAIRADACLRGGDGADLLAAVLCHADPSADALAVASSREVST